MTMRPHVVRQGEFLAQLAATLGFDADAIWTDPANEALRALRPDHAQLLPGDVLHVPATPPEGLPVRRGALNRFVARDPKVRIELHLAQAGETHSPFAGASFVVDGVSPLVEGTADAEGHVHFEVPVTAREVLLIFPDLGRTLPVHVGHLDPLETESGVRQRLEHLGHRGPDVAQAVRAFQRTQALPETGVVDEATRAALRSEHRS